MKISIRTLICMGAVISFSGAVARATLDYDGFNYTGTALDGQNGGSGWNGGWFTTGTSSANTLSDDGVSLAYPVPYDAPGSTPSSVGAHVKTGGTATNASTSRLLSTPINLAVDGTVMYASALIRKNVANGTTTGDNILLEFVDASANRRFGLGIEGTGDKPWLNANSSTTPAAGPTVSVGDTYLIVAKIVSSASSLDTAFLKVYGTGYQTSVPYTEPSTWDATLTETTSAILDRVRVRIDSANTALAPGEVDDIRVATDWATVVGAPEPSSFALLSLTALAGTRRRRRGVLRRGV